MKIEIWSDIMCPFCYVGKRHFEAALEKFDHKKDIEVEWKSFQLDPSAGKEPMGHSEYLSSRKGLTAEQVKQALQNVTAMAARAGLSYHLDKAVVANSFDAHRLSHLAKKYGRQDRAEELLFKAHFIDGKNIADAEVLKSIGEDCGIPGGETLAMLNSKMYAREVLQDIEEGGQLGVRGVPFFVFDRKYAVSGAQPVDVFFNTLVQSFNEWKAAQ